jgi:hypothetical protein
MQRTPISGEELMFELNQTYEFTLWVSGSNGATHHSWSGTVIEVSGPLLKYRDEAGAEAVVNTFSIAFVGAKLASPKP